MICACISNYMHIYPDRSGYKLYAVIILATGSCVLKYDPPLSTVDNSVTQKSVMYSYVFITCMCIIYTHVYIRIVCSTYCFYIYVRFPYFGHVSSVGFSGPKYAHELAGPTRTCYSRISASGAVLRSKLSICPVCAIRLTQNKMVPVRL